MRYAGNFHQEWGYLAPAPSFIRTARVILVAAAVGATAGAGVVFSLVGREDTETSVAARTLARPGRSRVGATQCAAASPRCVSVGRAGSRSEVACRRRTARRCRGQRVQAQFDHNGAGRHCGFGRGAGGD